MNWMCACPCVCVCISIFLFHYFAIPCFFGDIVSIGMRNMHVLNDMFRICWTYLHEKSIHVNFSNQLYNEWKEDWSFLPFYPC